MGGSSAINGLLYIRGQAADYDSWVGKGATGWSWDDMLPIFRRMEDQERGENSWHGTGGPIGVVDLKPRHPLMEAYIRAAARCGLVENNDFNGPVQDGIGYFQLTLRNGFRCSSATAYGVSKRPAPNLTVIPNAHVARIETSEGSATGVELLSGQKIRAHREVILSAGAIGSPHLLELSGIGDPSVLRGAGIEVRSANPAVGENLQDHFQAKLVFKVRGRITINDVLNNPIRKALVAMEYGLRRTGLKTIGAAQVSGFARIDPHSERPDMQIHAMPGSSDNPARGMDAFSAFTSSVSQLRPESRGNVHIKSRSAEDAPIIKANYLSDERDRRLMIASVKFARTIVRQPELSAYLDREQRPGDDVQNDDEILEFIRETGSTNYHPVGTCRIGPEGNGVVGPDLRVHGISSLRIADASVMPTIVSGNTNAPSIAIGEKLADLLTDIATRM